MTIDFLGNLKTENDKSLAEDSQYVQTYVMQNVTKNVFYGLTSQLFTPSLCVVSDEHREHFIKKYR
jgi:hypothetical protein